MTWTGHLRHGAALVLGGLACATVLVAAPAAARPVVAQSPAGATTERRPASPDEVYRALQVNEQPALYVFLVDTSASMAEGGQYDVVKQNLTAFFAALAPRDEVCVIPFAATADEHCLGAAGESPDDLLARAGLPPQAEGDNTDLGRAFARALPVVARSPLPVVTLVLLTDGRHAPAQGSEYKYTSGTSWDRLRDDADGIAKESFRQYAVPLRTGTDADLLRRVFPGAQVLPVTTPGQLAGQLQAPKDASRRGKARAVAAPDTNATVQVGWPAPPGGLRPGANRRTLTVTSRAARIPLELSGLQVRSTDPTVRARLDTDRIELRPGEARELGVTVEWDARGRSWKPYDETSVRTALTVTGRLDSPFRAVLAGEIGVALSPRLTGDSTELTGTSQRGRPVPWAVAVAVLGLLVAAGLLWLRSNPPLSGVLLASRAGTVLGALPLSGRRKGFGPRSLPVPGTGKVRARRRVDGGLELTVRYRADGVTTERGCRPAGPPVIIHGTTFTWDPDGRSGAGAGTGGSGTGGFRAGSRPAPGHAGARAGGAATDLGDGRIGAVRTEGPG